jgi:predicted XRE-type DNA-binding protein
VLEELLATEELLIWILQPALTQHLIGEVVGVPEDGSPAISRVGNGGRPGLSS